MGKAGKMPLLSFSSLWLLALFLQPEAIFGKNLGQWTIAGYKNLKREPDRSHHDNSFYKGHASDSQFSPGMYVKHREDGQFSKKPWASNPPIIYGKQKKAYFMPEGFSAPNYRNSKVAHTSKRPWASDYQSDEYDERTSHYGYPEIKSQLSKQTGLSSHSSDEYDYPLHSDRYGNLGKKSHNSEYAWSHHSPNEYEDTSQYDNYGHYGKKLQLSKEPAEYDDYGNNGNSSMMTLKTKTALLGYSPGGNGEATYVKNDLPTRRDTFYTNRRPSSSSQASSSGSHHFPRHSSSHALPSRSHHFTWPSSSQHGSSGKGLYQPKHQWNSLDLPDDDGDENSVEYYRKPDKRSKLVSHNPYFGL